MKTQLDGSLCDVIHWEIRNSLVSFALNDFISLGGSMLSEIGAELARLEKIHKMALQKEAQEERLRRQTDERNRRHNLDILERAFEPILESFNAATDRSLRLSIRNTPEALMVSRSSGTIIWLRVSASELYYRAPAQSKRAVRYRFVIEREAAGAVVFYPDNLPLDRLNVSKFVAMILKHSLGLLK